MALPMEGWHSTLTLPLTLTLALTLTLTLALTNGGLTQIIGRVVVAIFVVESHVIRMDTGQGIGLRGYG